MCSVGESITSIECNRSSCCTVQGPAQPPCLHHEVIPVGHSVNTLKAGESAEQEGLAVPPDCLCTSRLFSFSDDESECCFTSLASSSPHVFISAAMASVAEM